MFNRKFISLIGIVILLDEIRAGYNENEPLLANKAGSSNTSPLGRADEHINEVDDSMEIEAIRARGGVRWKRPDEVANYPYTWHRFVNKSYDGVQKQFEIKDIPEDRFNEVADLMALFVLKSRVCKALDLWADPQAVNGFKLRWKEILKQKMSVACFQNNTIIGINLLNVKQEDDLPCTTMPWNEKLKKLYDLTQLVTFNKYERYGVRKYLYSSYIGIDSRYERTEIPKELIKVVEKICWTFNIERTTFFLSTPELDRLAEKENFILDKGLKYNEMRKILPTLESFEGYGYSVRSMPYRAYKPPK